MLTFSDSAFPASSLSFSAFRLSVSIRSLSIFYTQNRSPSNTKRIKIEREKGKAVYLDVDVLGGSPLLAEDPTLAVAEVTGGSTSRSLHRVGLH